MASLLQSRISEVFGMDIHPAAQLGSSIMIDHATGVVIGETARVSNGCTLLHAVTLGGNGKQQGDRHPKLGINVSAIFPSLQFLSYKLGLIPPLICCNFGILCINVFSDVIT